MDSICRSLANIQKYYIPISFTILLFQCIEAYTKTNSFLSINNIVPDPEIKNVSIDFVIKNLEDRINKCDASIDEVRPILHELIKYNLPHL